MLFIKVLTLSPKTSENSKFSAFDWSNILLDQLKNGEIHHKGSTSFDWFPILVQSIEINIRSVERNSQSIETMKNFIMEFLPESIGSRFLFNQLKRTFDWSKGISVRSKLTKLKFFLEFSSNCFWCFCYFPSKHFLILWMKIHRSNIKVFKIKNYNNARNLENIILISLGINFITINMRVSLSAICIKTENENSLYVYIVIFLNVTSCIYKTPRTNFERNIMWKSIIWTCILTWIHICILINNINERTLNIKR